MKIQDIHNEITINLQKYVDIDPTSLLYSKGTDNGDFMIHNSRIKQKQISNHPLDPFFQKKPTIENLQQKIISDFRSTHISQVFVNRQALCFKVNKRNLALQTITSILTENECYGTKDKEDGLYVVEYSSPNIAKKFHLGHLRTTILGNFIKNLLVSQGRDVHSINYLGDWGKQFGLVGVGFSKYGSEEEMRKDPIKHLYDVYVKINKDKERDGNIDLDAKNWFLELENGNEKKYKMWKRFKDMSIDRYRELYKKLNVEFDEYSGESFYHDKGRKVIEELSNKKYIKDLNNNKNINKKSNNDSNNNELIIDNNKEVINKKSNNDSNNNELIIDNNKEGINKKSNNDSNNNELIIDNNKEAINKKSNNDSNNNELIIDNNKEVINKKSNNDSNNNELIIDNNKEAINKKSNNDSNNNELIIDNNKEVINKKSNNDSNNNELIIDNNKEGIKDSNNNEGTNKENIKDLNENEMNDNKELVIGQENIKVLKQNELTNDTKEKVISKENTKDFIIDDKDGSKYIETKYGKLCVIKNDGSTLYSTRDIAAAFDRIDKYNPKKILYVVASQQDLYFKQIFDIFKTIGLDSDSKSIFEHINYGMVDGMSTRKGTVVFLEHIINEAKNVMRSKMQRCEKKFNEIKNIEETCEILAVSAIVVQDFGAKRIKNYTFDMERSTETTGFTGPYLQYLHCRLMSIEHKNKNIFLAKEKENNEINVDDLENKMDDLSLDINKILIDNLDINLLDERNIEKLYTLIKYPLILERCMINYEPSTLITYLMDLCKDVSGMIKNCKVMGSEKNLAITRLAFFKAIRVILGNGLKLIGLTPLERM